MTSSGYTFSEGKNVSVTNAMSLSQADIQSELRSMHDDVKGHLSSWVTAVKPVYERAKAEWDDTANNMTASLDYGADTLEQITRTLTTADDKVRGMW